MYTKSYPHQVPLCSQFWFFSVKGINFSPNTLKNRLKICRICIICLLEWSMGKVCGFSQTWNYLFSVLPTQCVLCSFLSVHGVYYRAGFPECYTILVLMGKIYNALLLCIAISVSPCTWSPFLRVWVNWNLKGNKVHLMGPYILGLHLLCSNTASGFIY